MQLLLNKNIKNFLKNIKKYILYSFFFVIIVLFFINLQSFIIKVEAGSLPIIVSTSDLGFGIVFPGEKLEKEITITLDTSQSNGVIYTITQTSTAGYFDLCPFLEKINEEGEGDTENYAVLSATSTPQDLSDTWKVVFKVPAIVGFVAQDHIFGIVSQGGDYGCDVSVNILE